MSHPSNILFNVAGFRAAHTRLVNARNAYNMEGTKQSAYAFLCAHGQFFLQCAHAGLYANACGFAPADNGEKAPCDFVELLLSLGAGCSYTTHARLHAVRVGVSNEERNTYASAHALLGTL